MRWLYYDPLNVQEVEYRTAAQARFHAFWLAFATKVNVLESALSGGTAWGWNRWLDELLAEVDRRFQWEIVPAETSDRWRLAISVETHRAARPMLQEFLAAAPQVPGWSFHAWRPPMSYALARRWARLRSGDDCDFLAVKVRPSTSRNLDLVFTPLPDAPPDSPQKWLTVAYSASEAILGEEVFDRSIGSVKMAEPAEARTWWRRIRKTPDPTAAVPMSELATTVARHLEAVREELPAAPLAKLLDSRGWTTLEMQPTSEVAGTRRQDIRLLTASVASLAPLTAAHRSARFCSALHSKHHETFCYVQWQHDASDDTALLARREELERTLGRAIAPHGGCVIGGGIGEKYLYFDLAVTDLESMIPALRQSLLTHKPPHQCWLMFFDEELAEEWVGVHPHAPAPPR